MEKTVELGCLASNIRGRMVGDWNPSLPYGAPVMTASFPIQTHTRICASTGRSLEPGEKYFSALFDEAGQFVRKDYAADAWPGSPENAIAFWAGRVPELNQKRRLTFDDELLMECFARLADDIDPDRIRFRYVLALLLLRRKRLKFEDVRRDGEQEFMQLKCPKTASAFEVRDPRMSEADMETVQDEVFKLLGWE
jgi:hypothetical protein